MHLKGRKHAKIVRQKAMGLRGQYFCDLCKTSCATMEIFTMHVRGKKHQKKAMVREKDTSRFFCEECKFQGKDLADWEKHLVSDKHYAVHLEKIGIKRTLDGDDRPLKRQRLLGEET